MKVLALIVFAVASVSGLGSGPYLPSGWRPQGPAFYLPTEVQKPAENPLKDTILQGSEASGSDALREYGPPKVVEVSQDLTSQALPETVTEQAFAVIEAKFSQDDSQVKTEIVSEVTAAEVSSEDAIEVKSIEEVVTATEAIIEEKTTEALESAALVQGRSLDENVEEIQDFNVATTESLVETTSRITDVQEAVIDSNVEITQAIVDSDVESTQVNQETNVGEITEEKEVIAEIRTAVEGANNVVDALVNLENEIKAQQVQSNEEVVEVKSVQILGSSEQTPEGFLEYGPPGFREYGPPQGDELLRTGALAQEKPSEEQLILNNETRRRRFSPKFRTPRKAH